MCLLVGEFCSAKETQALSTGEKLEEVVESLTSKRGQEMPGAARRGPHSFLVEVSSLDLSLETGVQR